MLVTKRSIILMAYTTSLLSVSVFAEKISDVRNTKHNFSATLVPTLGGGGNRVVSATSEQQICVFCHTPHAAEAVAGTPLWNRKLSTETYETYQSGSLDATGPGVPLGQPNGISKLCLSCHDGTLAIGAVNVLNGSFTDRDPNTEDIVMQGTGPGGTMAPGAGTATGFTRALGINLTNDHPISLTYDSALALRDGEMRDPAFSDHVKTRRRGVKPLLPLQDGQVQCNTCHDPHIRDSVLNENIKFLRGERFQRSPPTATPFNPTRDIICLACHDKAGWVGSAHANEQVANERYTLAAATTREFPPDIQVWQTACLACHDPHTVQGSRRLLREGTDGPLTPTANGYLVRDGGNPAIEQTCFACHSSDGNTLTAQGLNTEVPDIKTDFTTLPRHMPITTQDQAMGRNSPVEVHNIGTSPLAQSGKDFIEAQSSLGLGNLDNRHAECTDCHNPHRVIKNRLFNANANFPDAAGTHTHDTVTPHTNIASGVLKGIWGVEPIYGTSDFNAPVNTITFTVKRGEPPINASTLVDQPYVTREYQVCLKCHSNYGYGDNPPMLGSFFGGTPLGTNGMTQYTNQAKEYNSPLTHMGEGTSGDPGGAAPAFAVDNHRSWHPVVRETGRTAIPGGGGIRNADSNNWTPPFNLAVGTQTMYCTDCHGSNTANGTAVPDGNVGTENGRVWGPHGSENNFLLKGPWSGDQVGGTGEGAPSHLCFKCHDYDQYGNSNGWGGGGWGGGWGGTTATVKNSGFSTQPFCNNCGGSSLTNLHPYHAGVVQNFRCNICHVAVPHGWKNKAFLVNLNDVGPEGGLAAGTQVRNGGGGFGGGGGGWGTPGYTQGPYYNRAGLKIHHFARSGTWTPANCGSVGPPGNGQTGVSWMAFGSESCQNLP